MLTLNREKTGFILIFASALLVLGGILSNGPIPQDTAYHLFVDDRTIWSIPNFWNVITGLPFVLVGLLGLHKLSITNQLKTISDITIAYTILFTGILLVGFGSSYYHLHPTNETLTWDRLPMTIAFMALFSIIISEFISIRAGKKLLLPLLLAGILSVIYWHFSELKGAGDLRFYALIQFYPILAIPIILLCFPSRCTHVSAYWWLLLTYLIAKLFEHFDAEVYDALNHIISGHSLKHVFAALGMYILITFYGKRECL